MNTFLRDSINKKDVRTAYNLFNEYRSFHGAASTPQNRKVVREPTNLSNPFVGAALIRNTAAAPSMARPRAVCISELLLPTTAHVPVQRRGCC